MKLTAALLGLGMALGTAWAQNPSIIDSTRAKLNAVQQQKTAESNAALAATQGKTVAPTPATSNKAAASPAKPAAGKTASASPAPVAPAAPAAAASKPKPVTVSPAPAPKAAAKADAAKPVAKADVTKPVAKADVTKPVAKAETAKPVAKKDAAKAKSTAIAVSKPAKPKPVVAVEDKKNPAEPKKETHKTISMEGRRDPFVSPVVNRGAIGSGCSTGKRCLAIDQIALTGIVKADTGMIAVVVNALNKAYFLRENDPVFNGYVVRITGDSIIFKETLQDKLGKPFTREVTKKISTPAV